MEQQLAVHQKLSSPLVCEQVLVLAAQSAHEGESSASELPAKLRLGSSELAFSIHGSNVNKSKCSDYSHFKTREHKFPLQMYHRYI